MVRRWRMEMDLSNWVETFDNKMLGLGLRCV